jgi:hypothetical protein
LRLKIEAKPKLQSSHNRVRRKTKDPAGVAAIHATIRVSEVDVIEKVEGFSTELSL